MSLSVELSRLGAVRRFHRCAGSFNFFKFGTFEIDKVGKSPFEDDEPKFDPTEPHRPPKFSPRWNFPKPNVPDDGTYEPAKLLAVWLMQRMNGRPYYEKMILYRFRLHDKKPTEPIIVKNTPSNNEMLWKVKHLIKVRPVTFPDGEPTDDDVGAAFVDHEGRLKIKKLLVQPHQIGLNKDFERKRLDYKYLRDYDIKKWFSRYD